MNVCSGVSWLDLQVPNDIQCGASGNGLICHLLIFFGEVSLVQMFSPFFKLDFLFSHC